jgi:hypothetical protein
LGISYLLDLAAIGVYAPFGVWWTNPMSHFRTLLSRI